MQQSQSLQLKIWRGINHLITNIHFMLDLMVYAKGIEFHAQYSSPVISFP